VVPDSQRLTAVLWKPFLDDIRSGGPVFFGFSAEFLAELFRSEGIESSDPVKTICDGARRLFAVSTDDAVLTSEALRQGASGFSPAIVLACQQVLAVEEMVREPRGFSENAYFPRLRRLMSPDLAQLSLNPFPFDEFEAIWRTLAKEIRSVPGSTDASITFRFGVETGVNKARSFPLSQGLLSLEDLRVIVSEVGLRRLRSAAPADIWRLLKRVRNRLGRRGQRLIGLGIFRDRVIDQVVAYAKKADATGTAREAVGKSPKDVLELGIYKDSTDWFSEEYRPILTVVATGDRVHSGSRLADEFTRLLQGGEGLILPPGELGDHWVCTSKAISLGPNDTFLVLGTSHSIGRVVERLGAAGVALSQSKQGIQGIGINDSLGVLEAEISEDALREVTVRDGRIVGTSPSVAGAQYRWIGGTCVDNRGHRFLRESLPIAIQFDGLECQIRDMRKINGHALGFDALQVAVRDATDDLNLEITFSNGRAAHLGVAICRRNSDECAGYLVDENGTIAPGVERVRKSDYAIIGSAERCRANLRGLSSVLCAQLLRGLKDNRGEVPSVELVAEIKRRVAVSRVPPQVRKVVEKLLDRDPRLPTNLVAILTRACGADSLPLQS
jgi:hypothetical protein